MARPNILLILADQHRHDCLGSAGHPDLVTPTLDRLAAEGTRYPTTWCPYPVCTPSRYSLLSSLYVHQHGAWDNHVTLSPRTATFPRVLREDGWRTTAVGKMHFTPTYLDVGFDHMVLAEQHGPGRWDDDYHRALRDAGLADAIDVIDQEFMDLMPAAEHTSFGMRESNLPEEWHSTTWITDRAIEELDRWQPAGGNLLMVGYIKPHHPFDPPAPWSTRYDPAALHLPVDWRPELSAGDRAFIAGRPHFDPDRISEDLLRRALALYYGSIAQIDHQIGRLLETMRDRGHYDDCLVIYTADHGEFLGSRGMIGKGHMAYESLMRVPLLVRNPRGGAAGAVSERLTSLLDIGPTALAFAGCAVPGRMQGIDLAEAAGHEFLVGETRWPRLQYALRDQRRKVLVSEQSTFCRSFDLVDDPCELNDTPADTATESWREMGRRLARWRLFTAAEQVRPLFDGPVIAGENVRNADPERHDADRAWYRDRCHAWLTSPVLPGRMADPGVARPAATGP